ncbi:MAG TPA: hypothetical protein VK076_05875 [Candidatus Sphingobacterium stercoripullorum]|nr:hypothetical protein [Candidatus Sphingobacterium stercoripullorum]
MMKISFYLLLFVLLGFTISCSKNDLSMSMDEHEIDDLENLNLLSNDPFEGFEKKCGPLLPYLDCTYSEDDNGQPKYNCEMRYNVEACYVVAVDEESEGGGENEIKPTEDSWGTDSEIYDVRGTRISNFSEYFKNIIDGANNGGFGTVVIYIKSPSAFNKVITNDFSDGDVGESFISITVGQHTRVFGFFPIQKFKPDNKIAGPSIFVDKSGGDFDLSLQFGLSNHNLKSFISLIQNRYLGELFSMSSKSDASLIRDLLYITNPDFEFSEVVYPNNIGRGVGVSNGYLAYDINENHSSFNLAIFNNGGGKAFNSN